MSPFTKPTYKCGIPIGWKAYILMPSGNIQSVSRQVFRTEQEALGEARAFLSRNEQAW